LAWNVEFDAEAADEFRNLDRSVQIRIQKYIRGRLVDADDPLAFARPLRGEQAGLWRFRVGSYRLICSVDVENATLLVLRIGHRRNVYD